MTTFNSIKERARSLAQRRNDDDLGPNRGTMDQEQARIERARQEARREARREKVQQRTQQARQDERERVLNDDGNEGLFSSVASTLSTATTAVSDGDDDRLDDVQRAMGTDFDGDGDALAGELGLQSARRADAEDRSIGAIEDLANENASRIGSVENDLDALSPQPEQRDGRSQGGGRSGQQRGGGRQSAPDLDIGPGEFDDDILGDL